jgi:hypothetical protein
MDLAIRPAACECVPLLGGESTECGPRFHAGATLVRGVADLSRAVRGARLVRTCLLAAPGPCASA